MVSARDLDCGVSLQVHVQLTRIWGHSGHNGTVIANTKSDSPASHEPTDAEPTTDTPKGPVSTLLKWLGIAIIGTTFAIWVYAFSGQARRPIPDLLDDDSFAVEAEPRCAMAREQVDKVPIAPLAKDGTERSEHVTQATDILEAMVDDLKPMVTGTERDQEMLNGWLSDWDVLIHDRRRYAAAVAKDPTSAFLITDTNIGEPLERRITRFAVENSMPSCENPGDVG